MIRTRFPPSPTGFLHVGSLRTALYNYLVTKHANGAFVLRIEDTDIERFVEGAVENLIRTLHVMGLSPDEGLFVDAEGNIKEKGGHAPYIQSQRLDLYRKYAEELLERGAAYRCYCTKERLDDMRKIQIAQKKAPMYDRTCRDIAKPSQSGLPFVIRQKIPETGMTAWNDLVRGRVEFSLRVLDDQVLVKSDGYPTYHLANIVDDHLMEISHVIRGEEWLSSTPKHLLLYQAFGWTPPAFAHLPLLLNKDHTKLSKRQGDVAVEDYLKKGYLPEAILNFVALLGWNPGTTQEIFSLSELIEHFSLDRVHKGGAVFDIEKLNWLNGMYIRKMPLDELAKKIEPFLTAAGLTVPPDRVFFENAIRLTYERFRCLADAPEFMKFSLKKELDYTKAPFENAKMNVDRAMAKTAIAQSARALQSLSDADFHDIEKIKSCLMGIIAALKAEKGQVLWPVRVALTAEPFSPGTFEVMQVLGKAKTLDRLNAAYAILT